MKFGTATTVRGRTGTFGLGSVNLLFGCVLMAALAGCGQKNEEEAFKGPVTVEQAASILDLSTFALMEGTKPPSPRGVVSLSYECRATLRPRLSFIGRNSFRGVGRNCRMVR